MIVVTGSTRGIGPGCVQVRAGEGATVVIADNDKQAGPEADLQKRSAHVLFLMPTIIGHYSLDTKLPPV